MKNLILVVLLACSGSALGQQTDTLHIEKLHLGKKKKEVYSGGRDSSMVIRIDTLVMEDRSQLVFYGKKDVTLDVGHAEIENRAYLFGTDGKNNGTDFDIQIRFEKLGALYVLAGGQDAKNNGSRTFPNGDGGDVTLTYDSGGIVPQTEDKKSPHYLRVDTQSGGYLVNPQSELSKIYRLINMCVLGRPLGNLSQGQVYSGTPGRDGKSVIKAKN